MVIHSGTRGRGCQLELSVQRCSGSGVRGSGPMSLGSRQVTRPAETFAVRLVPARILLRGRSWVPRTSLNSLHGSWRTSSRASSTSSRSALPFARIATSARKPSRLRAPRRRTSPRDSDDTNAESSPSSQDRGRIRVRDARHHTRRADAWLPERRGGAARVAPLATCHHSSHQAPAVLAFECQAGTRSPTSSGDTRAEGSGAPKEAPDLGTSEPDR